MDKEDLILQTLTQMQTNLNQIQTDVQDIKSRQVRMEQDHGTKLQALFDAREAQLDVNERIFNTLSRIEGKVDQLSLTVTSHEVVLKQIK